jgi:hypothetical protein
MQANVGTLGRADGSIRPLLRVAFKGKVHTNFILRPDYLDLNPVDMRQIWDAIVKVGRGAPATTTPGPLELIIEPITVDQLDGLVGQNVGFTADMSDTTAPPTPAEIERLKNSYAKMIDRYDAYRKNPIATDDDNHRTVVVKHLRQGETEPKIVCYVRNSGVLLPHLGLFAFRDRKEILGGGYTALGTSAIPFINGILNAENANGWRIFENADNDANHGLSYDAEVPDFILSLEMDTPNKTHVMRVVSGSDKEVGSFELFYIPFLKPVFAPWSLKLQGLNAVLYHRPANIARRLTPDVRDDLKQHATYIAPARVGEEASGAPLLKGPTNQWREAESLIGDLMSDPHTAFAADTAAHSDCHHCQKPLTDVHKIDLGTTTLHLRADIHEECRPEFIRALISDEQIPIIKRQEIARKYPEDVRAMIGDGMRPLFGVHMHSPPPPPPPGHERDAVGAGILTRIKRTVTEDKYAVDFASVVSDIISRVDWFQERLAESTAEIQADGSAVMEQALRKVVAFGFPDAAYARDSFTDALHAALTDEGLSQDHMPQSRFAPKAPQKAKWDNAELSNDLAHLMRRSLDGRKNPRLNKALMSYDVRRIVREVVDKRGNVGYRFLLKFPVSFEEAKP